jgi:phosphatidate cytidylyltransferase
MLFGLVSFWALREFITMTPTRRGDHRALFLTFFLFTPLQYLFVGMGSLDVATFDFYYLYTIVIPVYASLVIPARIALSNDHKRFLERSAKIQFGLLVCVYALSHAPALLDLDLQEYVASPPAQPASSGDPSTAGAVPQSGTHWQPWDGSKAGLLLYFVLIVQLSEVGQYVWDRLIGKHVVAPAIHATKTWEGFLAGALSTGVLGVLLWLTGITPFAWYGSGSMSLVVAIMGFAGSMTMSAIKRDRGVEDYGTLVQGHAGVLDRIDSMCFAAPVFFHLTRFFLGRPEVGG